MSSTLPPAGPPHDPQDPEYLTYGRGAPLQPGETPSSGAGRRNALIGGGAAVALALVGGGIWAATSFLGSGPQPAEALPDTTLGYASIDLDPSGGQKIEAVKTLRRFPAFKDEIGLDTDDDVRQRLFEEIQRSGACPDLDYADVVEPWLGDRAAVAAVDTGAEQPTPVVVVQVTDEERADAGLARIQECGAGSGSAGDGGEAGGWVIDDGWAVLAETEEIARGIADDAADAPLSDDQDYQSWTDEVGDAGIVNLYAAPAAGTFMAQNLGALEDFQGMAATVRFNDGAIELEIAGDPGLGGDGLYSTDGGDDVLATFPEETAAGIGAGFDRGWFTDLVEQMAAYSGGETSAAELLAELSAESGLDLPDDVETLTGKSMALGIGADFDPETLFNSTDGSGVPIAAKVQGDPEAIESVLDRLRAQVPAEESNALSSDSEGDLVAIGPDADYRSEVLGDGDLGSSDVFRDVVPGAEDASAIFFVNFDAGGGWLVDAAGGDAEVADNLEPLEGLGLSVWQEDDAAHALLRITTN